MHNFAESSRAETTRRTHEFCDLGINKRMLGKVIDFFNKIKRIILRKVQELKQHKLIFNITDCPVFCSEFN